MPEGQIIVGFLFPTDQLPPEPIDPRMRSFDNPSPCFESRIGFPLRFFPPPRLDVRLVVSAAKELANVLRVVPFVETDVLVGCGRRIGRLSKVASRSLMSCVFAPLTSTPNGTPQPSVSTDRFVPSLPRSVGFSPVFFPTPRRLGHRSVHALPIPLDAL